jgi:hypothetical protein
MSKHLLAQVDHTINIFEGLTNGCVQGLFLFDNVPSHQKHADNALSAHLMVKGVPFFLLSICHSHSRALRTKEGMDTQEHWCAHA